MFNTLKGWFGEKITTLGMWLSLDEKVYQRIDNVIIPARNGTTQIDHVLVSVFGIFVIETKNINGWIFGAPDQDQWTQVLYGNKYHFQNPLKQNYRHTKCLSEYLHLDHRLLHSVVFFIGECEFKTQMPDNVLTRGLSGFITEFGERCLAEEQVQRVTHTLRALKESSTISKTDHMNSLRARHESATQCPRCGSSLVQRTAKTGKFAGQAFFGCSKYPQCKYTRGV